ncbi:MAG: hypothetical protein INR73_21805 [Williamsia sp.]|nr:hypothetical protein [Williamsia sp.]
MSSELIIDGNKSVSIKRIQQRLTYDGLLEGLPTRKMNAHILQGIKDEARKFCYLNEIYLIEPEEKPIQYSGQYPFGEPAQLPSVICIVEVRSYSAYRDMSKDCSALGLIWFQDDFMFPIAPEIIEKIKSVPYAHICEEFNY